MYIYMYMYMYMYIHVHVHVHIHVHTYTYTYVHIDVYFILQDALMESEATVQRLEARLAQNVAAMSAEK